MGNKSQKAQQQQQQQQHAPATKVRKPFLEDNDFCLRQMGHHGIPHAVTVMTYTNIQRLMALGTATGIIKIFGKDGIEILIHDQNTRSPICALDFNRSGSKLFAFSSDTSFRVIDTTTYQVIGNMSKGWARYSSISCVHLPSDTDDPFIYVGLDDGTIEVINTLTIERTGYRITSNYMEINQEEDNYLHFIQSNPANAGMLLLGYETAGPITFDLVKRKYNRYSPPQGLSDLAARTGGGDSPSLRCGAFKEDGKQFVVGYASGHIAVFNTEKRDSGKIQPICPALSPCEYPKPVTHVQWSSSHKGISGIGCLLIAGGNEMNAVTILWPKPSLLTKQHEWKVGEVGIPMVEEDRTIYGMALCSHDSVPVYGFQLTYPQGSGPW
mgnify:CR=1 FL=1